MKESILARIRQLGGRTDQVTHHSLAADLQAIAFDTVLYPRPTDTPWASAADTEPIAGVSEVIAANQPLLATDPTAFYQYLGRHFYGLTEAPHGQVFYHPVLFTPFRAGTPDHAEWNDYFTDSTLVDLRAVYELTTDETLDFLQIAYSYGFPDAYYICLSDPQPENPTVFGTDHEEFFCPLTNTGSLEDFFQQFMPKEEFLDLVRRKITA